MGRHSISSQISGIILNILKGRNLIFSFFFWVCMEIIFPVVLISHSYIINIF